MDIDKMSEDELWAASATTAPGLDRAEVLHQLGARLYRREAYEEAAISAASAAEVFLQQDRPGLAGRAIMGRSRALRGAGRAADAADAAAQAARDVHPLAPTHDASIGVVEQRHTVVAQRPGQHGALAHMPIPCPEGVGEGQEGAQRVQVVNCHHREPLGV